MRPVVLAIVLQLFLYHVSAAEHDTENCKNSTESQNKTHSTSSHSTESNSDNHGSSGQESSTNVPATMTASENNGNSNGNSQQSSNSPTIETKGESNGNSDASSQQSSNSDTIDTKDSEDGSNASSEATSPYENNNTKNTMVTKGGDHANNNASSPEQKSNTDATVVTKEENMTTSVANQTKSTEIPTNVSANHTTAEVQKNGSEINASTENATTDFPLTTPDEGNSTGSQKNHTLALTNDSDEDPTRTQANKTIRNTTQASPGETNSSTTQNTTQLFTFEKGVNISASVFFYYDLDYEMEAYLRDQGDCKDIERYLRALLNSAELRFKPLENGSVKLLFGGSKLLSSHETQDIRVFQESSLVVSTLYMFKRFIQYHVPPRPVADIYVYISNWTMISEYDGTNTSVGYAYESGACSEDNVAVVKDNAAAYTGSSSLAQKIAILLGATWDVNRTEKGCMKEDGYLLSTYNASGKHYNLSRCSQRDMLANITNKRKTNPTCLNQTEIKPQSKKLPSEMFQYREYCRGYFNKDPYMQDCSKEQKATAHLGVCRSCCSNTTLLYKPYVDIVAPDGTKCGETQICISGECVIDPRTLEYQNASRWSPVTSVPTTS